MKDEIYRRALPDDDVLKALKCCAEGAGGCPGCPYNPNDCLYGLPADAAALIERQNREIERLTAALDSYLWQYGTAVEKKKAVDKVRAEAIVEFSELVTRRVTDAAKELTENNTN